MSQRTYKTTATPGGVVGIPIFEFREDGERDRCVVHLDPGARPNAIDVVEALQKAYEGGREDRSEEILGNAGLARASVEATRHRQQGIAVPGEVAACKCGRFEGGTIDSWHGHLAYEILQAAALLP